MAELSDPEPNGPVSARPTLSAMNRRWWSVLVLLVLAVSGTGLVVGTPAAVASGEVPGLIAPCTSVFSAPPPPAARIKTVVRPSGFFDLEDSIIGCAGNAEFRDLKWSTWGRSRAVGTGLYKIASCIPSCGASKGVFEGEVRLALSKPVHVMQHHKLFDVWGLMSAQLRGPSPKLLKASKSCTPSTCVGGVFPETAQGNEHWKVNMAVDLAFACKQFYGCTITTG